MVSPARATVQSDTPDVRVTEWRLPPDSATGQHRHAYDYVVVPMTSGRLRLETAGGASSGDLVAGCAYARQAGIEHDVINDNPYEFVFIEIEVKG